MLLRLRAGTRASGSQLVNGEEAGIERYVLERHGGARPPGMVGSARLRGAARRARWPLRPGPTSCLDVGVYYSVQDSAEELPALTA